MSNIQNDIDAIGDKLIELFNGGLPAQMGDKVENVVVGFREVLRIYGEINREIGRAIAEKDPVAAKAAYDRAEFFITDTARFIKAADGVDSFRKNSYIWAKRHCSPEAAAIMGTTDGTPEDYI